MKTILDAACWIALVLGMVFMVVVYLIGLWVCCRAETFEERDGA